MDKIESATLTDGRTFNVGDSVKFVLRGVLTDAVIDTLSSRFILYVGGWFYWVNPGNVLSA